MQTTFPITTALVFLTFLLAGCPSNSTPDFTLYPAGQERKEAFFNFFLPLIEKENENIATVRERLIQWNDNRDNLGWWDTRKVRNIAADYKIEEFDSEDHNDWERLIKRVDTIPPSLVLAQAAKESGWGTSRFSLEGNNYFGLWCFSKGCGLVPQSRADDKSHEVASFDTPKEAVAAYILNLNTHRAYKKLRNIRAQLRANNQPVTGIALAAGLGQYSERGDVYIEEIRSMIRFNNLAQFNNSDDL